MATWIALFRGINVGGKNVLPMKELVRHLQSLGVKDVQTYIQSGNAVFEASKKTASSLPTKIAARIENRHGFKPGVLILGADELQTVIDANPFPEGESNPKTLHCFFLESKPRTPDVKSLTDDQSPSECFQLIGKTFYLHAPDGVGRSKLAKNAEKCLGVVTTARNWRTVRRLSEMAKTPVRPPP